MKKAIIGLLGILGLIPIVCHAHAGMYDRYLELMNVLFALLKTIFLSQIVVFMFIKFSLSKFQKNIRLRLLLLAKRLCKNWWVNIIATWTISSFAISSYLYVFFMGAWLLAIVIFPIFWIIYLIIIAKSKTRERFFSGLRPIYYYLVASIGQIIVFIALFFVSQSNSTIHFSHPFVFARNRISLNSSISFFSLSHLRNLLHSLGDGTP